MADIIANKIITENVAASCDKANEFLLSVELLSLSLDF
jgi:hypothetical protein